MSTAVGASLPPVIVLAEDDDALRSLVTGLLRESFPDHDVQPFDDGLAADEGIETLLTQRRRIDLVLSDLVMPRMDGLELLERVAEREPGAARIILTGQGALESAVQSLRLGVDDYLTKPFGRPELVRTLKRHLEARALARENRRLQKELEYSQRTMGLLMRALLKRFDKYLEPILELPQVTEERRLGAMHARRAFDIVARVYRLAEGDRSTGETVGLSHLADGAARSVEQDRGHDADAVQIIRPAKDPLVRIVPGAARMAIAQLLDNAVTGGTGRVAVMLLGEGRNWPDGVLESDLSIAVRQALAQGSVGVAIRNTAALTREDEAYIRRVLRGRPSSDDEFRGLGLPLAQMYATLLGGRIVFQWRSTRSEVIFTILLPSGR